MAVKAKKEVEMYRYEYEKLLLYIRKHLDREYGGVANFLDSKDFVLSGFEDTPSEQAKMYTYLSLPPEGQKARVKSFPVLKKLYKYLLGINIKSKIKVSREQIILSDFKIM